MKPTPPFVVTLTLITLLMASNAASSSARAQGDTPVPAQDDDVHWNVERCISWAADGTERPHDVRVPSLDWAAARADAFRAKPNRPAVPEEGLPWRDLAVLHQQARVQRDTLLRFATRAEMHAWMRAHRLTPVVLDANNIVDSLRGGAACARVAIVQWENPPSNVTAFGGLARLAKLGGVRLEEPDVGTDPGCNYKKQKQKQKQKQDKRTPPQLPTDEGDAGTLPPAPPAPRDGTKTRTLTAIDGARRFTAVQAFDNCQGDGWALDVEPIVALLNDVLRARKSALRFVVLAPRDEHFDLEERTVLLIDANGLAAARDHGVWD